MSRIERARVSTEGGRSERAFDDSVTLQACHLTENITRLYAASAARCDVSGISTRLSSYDMGVIGYLFLAFIVVPVVEIFMITQVASQLGWLPTILLVIGVSLVGAWLVKREGLSVIGRVVAG